MLVLVARGASTRHVARTLGITPKTAGNHIERIYAKIGASSRATATLFAMQHGMLATLEPVQTPEENSSCRGVRAAAYRSLA